MKKTLQYIRGLWADFSDFSWFNDRDSFCCAQPKPPLAESTRAEASISLCTYHAVCFSSNSAWWMTICRMTFHFSTVKRSDHMLLSGCNILNSEWIQRLNLIMRLRSLSGLYMWKTFPFKYFLCWEVHKTAQLHRVSPQANIVLLFLFMTLRPFESQQGVISCMNMWCTDITRAG